MRRGFLPTRQHSSPVPPEPGLMLASFTRRQEFYIVLGLALAVRLLDINAPFTSEHWIKQLQIAPIAKNFATESMNVLWPKTDYSADRPAYIEIEFQLVTWLSAMLYKVFGIHEWCARLVTISFSMAGMALLYRLILMYLGPGPAIYGLVFYAFVPSSWYFSRVLMSEPLMLCFSIALVYAFSRYLATGSRRHFVWTVASGALCFLVKLPAVMLVVPLLWLAQIKFRGQALRRPDLWAIAVMSLLPAIAYYAHARMNIGREYFTVGVGFGGGMWFSLDDFLKPGNYSLMLTRMVHDHLTPVGIVLLILGLVVGDRRRIPVTVFHVWLGVVAVYFVLVSGGNLRQNYYQLHMLPPAAALVGYGWHQLVQSQRFSLILSPLLLAVFVALCVWGVEPKFQQVTPIHACAAELNRLDPDKHPVLIFPAGYGCLYYFDRPGWVGREGFGKPANEVPPEDIPGPDYIDARILRGARWAVYFDFDSAGQQPMIQEYLGETFRQAERGPGYTIFDLTRTSDGQEYRPLSSDAGRKRFSLPWSD